MFFFLILLNSFWEKLPDMIDYRSDHACERIKRNGRDYLVVVGGRYGLNGTITNTIESYDLTLRPTSWETLPEIPLPVPIEHIYGSKITTFDEGLCEAYIINSGAAGFICSGNYTWSYYRIANVQREGFPFFPVLDAKILMEMEILFGKIMKLELK